MTLTKEQKLALTRVVAYMDEMYAIASPYYGCTEDANILRSMIDSSEHIREPPKMVGFDLVARIRELEAENVQLLAALDESERVVAHKTKSAAHWYDEHLQARADRVQTRRVVEQQAARIKELEDAHKRSGAKYAKIINELRSSVYANMPGLKKQWDEILNTPANDKIGPDADAKPRVWQITEERKAAIKELSELLTAIGCPSCHYYIQKNYGEDITVLRAMLTEADHDKP